MGTKKRRDEEPEGPEWAATAEEVLPVMREIARVAFAQKLSFGELARRLNEANGSNLSTKNVSAHFRVKKMPRNKTLDAYTKILGLSPMHIALVRGGLVGSEDAREVLVSGPVRFVLLKSSRFKKSVAENVKQVVGAMLEDSPEEARRIASRVLLAANREAIGLPDEIAEKYPDFSARFGLALTVFADAVKARVNLFEAPGGRDPRLARVWVHLGALFSDPRDSQRVIDQIVRLLKKRGIKTAAMEATLREVQSTLMEGLSIPTRAPLASDFDI